MPFYTEKKEAMQKRNYLPSTKKYSLPGIQSPNYDELTPRVHPTSTGRRAAFFSSLSHASFTVEAAFILPLFLLTCLSIFSMLDFYRIYVAESVALKEKAQKAAIHAYTPGKSEGLQELYPDGYLVLSKTVRYQIPYSPFPLPKIQVPCHARVHVWCGYMGEDVQSSGRSPDSEMVYVTDYESVYHISSGCTHLDLHIYTKTLNAALQSRNKDGVRYQPCDKCIGEGISHGYVYVTERGTAYHNNLECSGLKRRIRLIKLNDASAQNLCSRCQYAKGG